MASFGRVLLSGFGFAVGFVVTAAVVCLLNIVYRGAWLPVGTAILFGFLLGWPPALRDWPKRGWAASAFGLGAVGLWIMTTDALPVSRGAKFLPLIVPLLLGLGLFQLVLLVLAFYRDPAANRSGLWWLLGLMLMGWMVAYFSSDKGGADPMIGWARTHLGLDAATAEHVVVLIRKTIHFTFYGLAGAIAWRLAAESGLDARRAIAFAVAAALLFAVFDEMRQAGIAGRTGSAWDVLLDLAGAVAFAAVLRARHGRPSARSIP